MNRNLAFIILAVLIACLVGFAGYYYASYKTPAPTTSQETPAPQPSTNPPIEQPSTPTTPKTYIVKVYFSKHPESDDDPSKVFAVDRTTNNLGVGKFAISELLKGPTATEQSQGYFSYVRLRSGDSTCGGNDISLNISSSGVATLKFCRPFDHIGSVSDGQAESEINATLKQFSSVKKVVILNYVGDCEFNLSGLNLCKQ